MRFGHLDDVSGVDFALPPDHAITASVLTGDSLSSPRIFAGLSEWGNGGFDGKIYPKGSKPKEYSKLYGAIFNCIELNAMGYRVPSVTTIQGWSRAVPVDFKFCPKVSQPIAQVKPLGCNKEALAKYYEDLQTFGYGLGTVFLQLHPNFSPERYEDLVSFLETWDHTYPLAVELRHGEWFSNSERLNELFEHMRRLNVGTVITDTSGRRDAVHMGLTTLTAYIRFVANDLHPTDFSRIEAWVERIASWFERGLETVYFFSHSPTKSLTPELSNYFLATINQRCGFDLKLAPIISEGEAS